MTISESSIKILASERLTDDSDGGGFMTPVAVVDGVENNLFQDLSSLDRAQGRVNLRKVYPAVLTSTVPPETYLGAHCMIDEIPADDAVSAYAFSYGDHATLFAASATALSVAQFVQSFVSSPVASAAAIGDTTIACSGALQVGEAYSIPNNGFRVVESITGGGGMNFVEPLTFAILNGTPLRKLTINPSALKLYGCVKLGVDAGPGDISIKVDTPFVQTDPVRSVDDVDYGVAPIFRPGDVIVIHHTISEAAQTVVDSQDVNLGRVNLADVRIFDAGGNRITTNFTVNKATGHVVFGTVSGYSQPIIIKHRIEDMVAILPMAGLGDAIDFNGLLKLSKQISHDFPADETLVSSAIVFGDMQARAHLGFQQATWTSVFSDTIIGSGISADYNEPANPIIVTNDGAIKERWALVFTNTTTFNIIGEQVGIIGTGNVGTATAPNNPGTGHPYFSIPSAGWGAGWAIGNVYRFNTSGANAPVWIARNTKPSDPYVGQDKITLAIRGDIDA